MPVPFTWLYKFHAMNINSLSALSNNKAWFSSLSSLNDPFEGSFCVTEPKSDDDFRHLLRVSSEILYEQGFESPFTGKNLNRDELLAFMTAEHESNPENFMNFIKELMNDQEKEYRSNFLDIATYCLASDIPGDERSHVANSLMWSHYADGLKGFCIKFNGERLYNSFIELNKDKKIKYAYIRYEEEMHKVNFIDFFGNTSKSLDGALHTKHKMWDYECEIRFLTGNNGYVNYSQDSVESVYIGVRMPSEQKKLLVDVIKHNYPNAKIHVVRFHKSSFSIEIGNWVD
ncbi:DUF2971 domain-containing protein [Serratia quinivorans]|uniref:DUF2971 domain-containing protein n=1 Tax=Serratia quinivorans TaxID=137545 RepID=UPI00217CBAA3|nr:DUF2971 domain-containing protein [Serratia quinivorans]CAI1716201.1 Protein of uncharacterised function (DUF2971) [Serratia quinivorans]CAI1799965.1 Protein of uncharacterised function (DUF2971) [Serratia quinivorans]